MKYKGDSIVLTFAGYRRNEDDSYSYVYSYTGTEAAINGLIASVPRGVGISRGESGAFHTVDFTYANASEMGEETPVDKWEDDTEILEKDILFSALANLLSESAKRLFIEWRKEPTESSPAGLASETAPVQAAFLKLQQEVLRGVESISVKTSVLKRTRTVPSFYVTPRQIVLSSTFYSTSRLISNENIPADVANQLPDNPAEKPDYTEWGWLPRNSNRTFTGKGRCEEVEDWVFASWSTNLYTYSS